MSAHVPEHRPRTAAGPGLVAFEALEFDVDSFDHAAHVYVAWQYVHRCDLLEAITRYSGTLRRLTASIGVPDKYHETITWFFIILIAERVRRAPQQSWEAFRAANEDVFSGQPAIINAYYSEETLRSPEARQFFLLPQRPGRPLTGAAV